MQTVVIGAGVVGASIATGLARRGAQVTLVDRGPVGAGTSATSYAWVNSNGKEPDSYFALNAEGVRAHHRLAADGSDWLGAGGHVEIAVDEAHVRHLRGRMDRMVERGYPVEEIDPARARDLLPDVLVPDAAALVAYFREEAFVHPQLYLAHVLGQGLRAGVRLRTGDEVVALSGGDGGAQVTLADGTVLAADRVVSAVGRWTSDLAALAGTSVPMATYQEPGDLTVGYLLETDPVPVRLDRVVTTPWLNLRPSGGGRLLLQALDLDATADPEAVPGPDSPLAEEFLQRLRAVVPQAAGARIRRVLVGQRAMPADGLTVVGPAVDRDWLYVVATHSGVTLAPFLGEAVAAEVLGDGEDARFADFRPARFEGVAEIASPRTPRKPGEQ